MDSLDLTLTQLGIFSLSLSLYIYIYIYVYIRIYIYIYTYGFIGFKIAPKKWGYSTKSKGTSSKREHLATEEVPPLLRILHPQMVGVRNSSNQTINH